VGQRRSMEVRIGPQLHQLRATTRALGLCCAAAIVGSAFLPWLEWHEGPSDVIVGNNAFYLLHFVSRQGPGKSVTQHSSWYPWYQNPGWLVVLSGVLIGVAIFTPQRLGRRRFLESLGALAVAAGIALALYESLTAYRFRGSVDVYSTIGSGERLCLAGAVIGGCAYALQFAKRSSHKTAIGAKEGAVTATRAQSR
jgi:hypothetical protein